MLGHPIRKIKTTRKTTGIRPTLEGLERRVLLSTFKVNTKRQGHHRQHVDYRKYGLNEDNDVHGTFST
jgi:hypothetical protein